MEIVMIPAGHLVAGVLVVAVYILGTYFWVRYDLIPAVKRKKVSEIVLTSLIFALMMAGLTVFVCNSQSLFLPFWELITGR